MPSKKLSLWILKEILFILDNVRRIVSIRLERCEVRLARWIGRGRTPRFRMRVFVIGNNGGRIANKLIIIHTLSAKGMVACKSRSRAEGCDVGRGIQGNGAYKLTLVPM
jgi:hypothetical protein